VLPRRSGGERLLNAILALKPANDAQRWYQVHTLELSREILQTRWIVFNGAERSVPQPFLIVVIFWLTALFGSFALFTPRNATTIGARLICALSVAASIFLILEMEDSFGGVMRVSDAPMRFALSQIGRQADSAEARRPSFCRIESTMPCGTSELRAVASVAGARP
jgi:hypothetical protein